MMSTETGMGVVMDRLASLEAKMDAIHSAVTSPHASREWYCVEEVAKLLGKSTYTVREWCREGRINAKKRCERRGGAELWSISAGEVNRLKDEGLLPPDPARNFGR